MTRWNSLIVSYQERGSIGARGSFRLSAAVSPWVQILAVKFLVLTSAYSTAQRNYGEICNIVSFKQKGSITHNWGSALLDPPHANAPLHRPYLDMHL